MLLKKHKAPSKGLLSGQWGEKECEKFLKKKGLKVLTHNFSCKTGEIDLIMVDADKSIVFVEVKSRLNEEFADAEAVITNSKKTKLIKTAKYFIHTNNLTDRPFRFDIVILVLDDKGKKQIRHYENAFVPR